MEYLPKQQDQQWLLEGIATLVKVRGAEQFLQSPIVEPTAEYFPDPVTSVWTALDRVTRRLMQYSGLGELDVDLRSFRGSELEVTRHGTHCGRIAGIFAGIEGRCCRFGVNADLPPEIEDLAGVMAHEVAHAYRAYHRLSSDDNEVEERLTDVTTTYLGFGILAGNNSYRFRKSGYQAGAYAVTSWSTSGYGYLTPQAHSFLLAAQMVARKLQPSSRQAIYRQLETNQAAFVRAAVKELEQDTEGLAAAIGITRLTSVGAPRTPQEILTPLKPLPGDSSPAPFESARDWNRGTPIFRIRHTREFSLPLFASCLLAAIVVLASAGWMRAWYGAPVAMLAGAFEGRWRAKRDRYDVCSDRECGVVLAPDLTSCPKCGGEVIGILDHLESALEMSDKISAARKELGR